jgi:very-short-patch-repair endonuclease
VIQESRKWDDRAGSHAGLAALAGRQHGVVSVAQLRELGLSKHAVRNAVQRERLLPVHRGIYAVGHAAPTLDACRMAAVLACGVGALLSHRAGAELQGLVRSAPRFEVTVAHGRQSRDGIVVHRSRLIHDEDRDQVRGIPVTSVARTLVDLADVLSEDRLADAVHEAEVQRRFDLRAVERTLKRLPGRQGRHKLQRILVAYRPQPNFTRTRAERRLIAICERHGLPRPQTNLWLGEYEVDAYWDDVRVAVEVDGRGAHLTRKAFQEDRTRDRRLAGRGIRVVRVTWDDLFAETRLAAELRAVRAAAAPAAGSPPAPACA